MKRVKEKMKDATTNSQLGKISRSVTRSDIMQELYNRVPAGITSCKSGYEAKMYTSVILAGLCIAFPPLVFVAWYMYCFAEKDLGSSISEFEKKRNIKNNSHE